MAQPAAHLQWHRGTEAHQGEAGGPLARMVLRAAFGTHGRGVLQEAHERHLYRPQSNVNLGTLAVCGRTAGHGTGECTPFPGRSTAPANGAESTFSGVELTWQHIMENGFGTRMQFTRTGRPAATTSTATSSAPSTPRRPLPLSAGLLYEKGPFSADVTWDYPVQLSGPAPVHRGSGLAGHLRSLSMGHRERALQLLRGVSRSTPRARISRTRWRALI